MTDTKKKNTNLSKARKDKNNEFYTQLSDIENEVKHYKSYFKDKIVYCNCDDYEKSSFFEYFSINFKMLGLKKLITTCYKSKDSDEPSKNDSKHAVCLEYFGSKTRMPQREDVKKTILKEDGDFRSKECIELLKQADIVVTNPPFSLFKEYVAQLIEYNKQFLIIGNLNAITYKEIFPLIKNNKLWVGITMDGRNKWFRVPKDYPINENAANSKIENDEKYLFVKGCLWYTNLDTPKRHEDIILYKEYTDKEYPKYDNYDAIEVGKVKEIPMNYFEALGVPITFLNKYNPEQFEIIWTTDRGGDGKLEHLKKKHDRYDAPVVNGVGLYKRIIIKRKK